MKQIVAILSFIFLSTLGHTQDFNGLWKVIGNVWDGTTERYDNLYFNVKTDSVDFFKADSIIGKGKIINDTIYIVGGVEIDLIDWIRKVNTDSLISSPSNSKHLDNISYKRINLTGSWEQLSYTWEGGVYRDTCEIVQEKDSVYFYESTDCFATAYLKKDSIIVLKGFDGIGIDFFSMNSNDSFYKVGPLVEAINVVEFLRLGQTLGIESIQSNSIQVFPNPTEDYIRATLDENRIQKIRLYSMTGENLMTKYIDQNSVDLNISDLAPGIYILELESIDGKVFKKKILKE